MLSSRSGRLRLLPRLVVFVTCVYGFIWISGFPRQYDDDELPPSAQRSGHPTPHPPHRVENDQLVVSVRTTALDAYRMLPLLILLTDGKYHDTLLLMGDLHVDIGPFHVHDVLERYDRNFVERNEDLARYRRQLEFAQNSIPFSALQEGEPTKEREAIGRLDKYKVLRMLEKAWELKPHKKWYAFVDPDTYLVRSNLLSSLGQFDPSDLIFFANPLSDTPDPFAKGGNTFILSGQTMRALFVDREDALSNWDPRISEHESAYGILEAVLSTELDLRMNKTWPGITGYEPSNIPYGPGMWCERVIAMHHVPPDTASDTWRLQRDRDEYQHLQDPILYADLWIRFMQPENLDEPRDDWDNLSSAPDNGRWNILFEGIEHDTRRHGHYHRDEEGRATSGEESWEACRESCNNSKYCVQWSYSTTPEPNYNQNPTTRCHLSRSMRFGTHVAPQEIQEDGESMQKRWKSGWRKDRFQTWARQQRCKDQQN